MEINEFIEKFAEQFIDTDPSQIKAETKFRDLEEWSSLLALSIMAMISEEYDVILSAQEMRDVDTVQKLYDLVNSKL
ncbi:MAG: acyl carrier protein [Paludibacteraceae bacterium]|jgi:acyl carrier protein|nr:acyl carrier protein [Paludibacteraceae bacterium]